MPIDMDEFEELTDSSVKDANEVLEFLQENDDRAFTLEEIQENVELEGDVASAIAELRTPEPGSFRAKNIRGETYFAWTGNS